ncbi:hypothetical protein GCM10010433_04450 [Streptomyces pulveraceus]|uniref:Uncharacterized protein n=1 Tax=Streptomyces pulveraceus TaxID=68258 RepID=A0ABW1GNN4_9ACTN
MGMDITVMIADWSWLGDVPERERLSRLRNAWYADETGLWDHDAPVAEGDWEWPKGPNGAFFALYEFRHTLGSYKPHFWATHDWERVRDHAPRRRRQGDSALLGVVQPNPDQLVRQLADVTLRRPAARGQPVAHSGRQPLMVRHSFRFMEQGCCGRTRRPYALSINTWRGPVPAAMMAA